MPKAGSVILARVQFADTFEIKTRPAVVLFEEHNNIIIAGITSNTQMQGIPLTKKEGAISDSVIKPNYIFTISKAMVFKELFFLSREKKRILHDELVKRLSLLQN
ncbi:TPA: type II toxin-antitoxin system PemK/MazF family toxin [Candidatus Woesearchaeota archaeon]|nr:type II toxin-antitoxin system PemK/MazF family toxin [Candidatus Woesearchaeota archaeon]HIH31094.1 type II toxin-antitoxin system PemK/MazF family toxin [Candidatus Woesearchaeota archaeon]HIH55602.1 type II toxin-antitoxin system PemK/MazF family toxin [Candidatus Woesearchaeota archaeon]HIJ01208.1 type II toxin-antitoxin system PemK/MazF family toxin [Candidatus Woesearchaeota archaeon]HIJ14490.1 type II toxin-antitoxin system PemK/MazF family toxin [Candidatus Woesearchaeota archaeon]